MKNFLFLILIAVVAFSCKKDKNNSDTNPSPTQPYSYLSSDFGDINETFYINVYALTPGDSAYSLGKTGTGQKWDYSTIPLSSIIDTVNFFNPSSSPDYYLQTQILI